MIRVRIRIPCNFRSFRTGFNCPTCGREVNETMKDLKACHKTRCPSCFEEVMVHIRKSPSRGN